MFAAFRIRPVVESTGDNGTHHSHAFNSLTEAADSLTNMPHPRRLMWTLYGVQQEHNGEPTETAIAARDNHTAALELLISLVGVVQKASDDLFYPQLSPTREAEILYELTSRLAVDLFEGFIPRDKLPDNRSRQAFVTGWANEFNERHRGRVWSGDRVWGGEYVEAVNRFYEEKTAHLSAKADAVPFDPISDTAFLQSIGSPVCRTARRESVSISSN